ncbi:MAG: hypothetical protein JNK87_39830 [Bryobacterales bacterium]|nr:hypothetical protein [Bryobacterales bacterium]
MTGLAWCDGSLLFAGQIQAARGLWELPFPAGKPALVPGAGRSALSPSCSSDGKRIVYSEHSVDRNIWVTRKDPQTGRFGQSRKLIASSQQEHSPSFFAGWPLYRIRFAIVSDRSGAQEIWICGSDGRAAHTA